MNRTLLIWQSVLAGLQVMAASTALAGLVNDKWLALFQIFVAGAQIGTATFIHGLASPVQLTAFSTSSKPTTTVVNNAATLESSGPVGFLHDMTPSDQVPPSVN